MLDPALPSRLGRGAGASAGGQRDIVGIAWVEAVRLGRANRDQQEELVDRESALQKRAERERLAQDRTRQEVYEQVLVPFRDAFARLKNIDLAELASIDLPATGQPPQVQITQVRLSALQTVGALAGGLGAGAGASAGAAAAVTAFAAASTGTSISALSGAAATSATLAWLGGGSLAAGGYGIAGGTVVLGGLVAAPAVLATVGVVAWQGRRQRRRQREDAEKLSVDEVNLARAEDRTAAVIARSRQVRALLSDLQVEAGVHLEELRAVVASQSDYAQCTPAQRSRVATTVSLVTTTVSVMSTPLTDEDGVVSDLSGQVVTDAHARLQALAGDRSREDAAARSLATTAPAAAEASARTTDAMSRGTVSTKATS